MDSGDRLHQSNKGGRRRDDRRGAVSRLAGSMCPIAMLLATDLDGTFLGGNQAARLRLYQLVASHPDIELVFVTGRGLEHVLPLLADPTIPQPDYIIADVGATVVHGETQQPVSPHSG